MEEISRTYVLSGTLYPSDCVERAIEEFRPLCEVQRKQRGNDIEIALNLLAGASEETPEEFLNFLLCASIEKLLA
jgi:hypothetical protein